MCIKQVVNKVNFDFMLTLIKTDPTALSTVPISQCISLYVVTTEFRVQCNT